MQLPRHRSADHPRRRLLQQRTKADLRSGGRLRRAEQRSDLRQLLLAANRQRRRPLLLQQLQQQRIASRPLQPQRRHGGDLRHLVEALRRHQERQPLHRGRRKDGDRPRETFGGHRALHRRSAVPARLLPLPAGAGVGRCAPARQGDHLAQPQRRADGRNAAGAGAQMVRQRDRSHDSRPLRAHRQHPLARQPDRRPGHPGPRLPLHGRRERQADRRTGQEGDVPPRRLLGQRVDLLAQARPERELRGGLHQHDPRPVRHAVPRIDVGGRIPRRPHQRDRLDERPHRRPDRPAFAVGNDQLLGVGLQLLLRLLQRLLHPLAALLGERPHGRRNGQRHGHRQAADVEPAGLQLPRNEQPENLVQEQGGRDRDALLATDAEHVQDAVGLQQQFRHARHRGAGPDDRERVRPRRSGLRPDGDVRRPQCRQMAP